MTLCRHSSRLYMDEYDLDGVLKVLADRIGEGTADMPYYVGAHLALNILRNHEYIDTQREFMALFDSVITKREKEE